MISNKKTHICIGNFNTVQVAEAILHEEMVCFFTGRIDLKNVEKNHGIVDVEVLGIRGKIWP